MGGGRGGAGGSVGGFTSIRAAAVARSTHGRLLRAPRAGLTPPETGNGTKALDRKRERPHDDPVQKTTLPMGAPLLGDAHRLEFRGLSGHGHQKKCGSGKGAKYGSGTVFSAAGHSQSGVRGNHGEY